MKRNLLFAILSVLLLLPVSSGFKSLQPQKTTDPSVVIVTDKTWDAREESKKFIDAIRIFADNALKYGMDVYGPKKTPLFVDGLNIDSHEPVKWKFPKGDDWVLVNIGNQQNFFRTLCGLSALTGDKKYKEAATEALRYSFKNLRFDGLLAWGGHMAYNATADSIVFAPDKGKEQELKSHYPFYELMWEVDPVFTKTMMEHIWNSHIMDWTNLDFNRHGIPQKMGKLWDNEYRGGDVFFWGKGLTFKNAGSDMFYSAALLSKFTGDEKPLIWAKRMAYRYVETRNPKTGLSGFQFSQMASAWCDGPKIRGDRAKYQYGDDFPGHLVVEGTLFPCYGNTPYSKSEFCSFYIADLLGEKGNDFRKWALEEVTSWAVSSYRRSDNTFIPMLTDGTSMEGYVCKKDGYFGPKGRILTAGCAGGGEFLIYARACEETNDTLIWNMARNIAKANKLGDIGTSYRISPNLNFNTDNSDFQVLFGFLSLYHKTKSEQFLKIATTIGNNILKDYFKNGIFITSKNSMYAKFDNAEPLALLILAEALEGSSGKVPKYSGGKGFFASAYGDQGHKYDNLFIYSLEKEE